ncbi:MAG: ATP-dependent zinc protease [Alcanivorax sp.]|nr:ATP-dependent zinc protease [Alcanivorax sp.]
MRGAFYSVIFLMVGLSATGYATVPEEDVRNKSVLGHIEKVRINGDDRDFSARLDTGAQRSSMHAREIEKFERDGEQWVRFVFDDHDGGEHDIESPLIEQTRVRQAGGVTTRYVVSLPLCIGEQQQDTEFTLTDRSAMTYPMLVGRNFLSEHVLVSSAHRYTADPVC